TPLGVDEGKNNIEGGIKKGHVAFRVQGKKINGEFDLVQTHGEESDGGKNWLLIKHEDNFARREIANDDLSVRSGRTMAAISSGKKGEDIKSVLANAKRASMAKSIDPMLATLVDKPFDKNGWIFEIKWDGYRTVAFIEK